MEEPKYISVREAAKRAGYSQRHFHRFLDQDKIAHIHENKSSMKVEVESLNAWLEQRGERAIDPMELMKQEMKQVQEKLAAQEHVNGKLTLEDAELRNVITKVLARVEVLEAKVRTLAGHRSRGAGVESPDGTIMLVDFAEMHAIAVSKLRTLARHDPTLATIIERPGAKRLKHKWMIGPDQQVRMLAVLQGRGIVYTPCGQCPHAATEHPQLAQ